MIIFSKKQDSFFTEGNTPKGNHIYFAQIPEEYIAFADENKPNNNIPSHATSSPLVIYCDFMITDDMKKEINRSEIIKINSICNNGTQLILLALPGFSYDKLKSFLNRLAEKFDL